MFGIIAAGIELECVTFNENGYYLYDPYEALESSVDFYYSQKREMPDWANLLTDSVLSKIKAKYP